MSRQQDHLERLHNKLSRRYGPGDMLCAQLSVALESCRKFDPAGVRKRDWSVSYAHTIAAYRLETLRTSRH